ncbi:MAG: pyridoxine 5'-phosphate synthase [Alphaproteobacteria bacterium]|nr:pyridoxine 5'-phosphate synthase [Alphaproteobacteria bacterium]MBE8221048.1 pyridoxine 5'-phosphate synthase [Alphaproteobacteria bacterium]
MSRTSKIRLGVNVDHIATIRNARGGAVPDPVRAAQIAEQAGADGITAHLREDRRHISDADIARLVETLTLPLNLEMAATPEMLAIALRHKPNACCLVPEKRQEITTEGGLDVVAEADDLASYIAPLQEASIRVSLFIDPDKAQIETAHELGADCVELHTGSYCHAFGGAGEETQWVRLMHGASFASSLGLEVHAGHGLNFETAEAMASLPEIAELNIGHFLVSEGVFIGLAEAIARMRAHINKGGVV